MGAYVAGAPVALTLGLVLAGPFALRLGWLWSTARGRTDARWARHDPQEREVPAGTATVLVRRPVALAAVVAVPVLALWASSLQLAAGDLAAGLAPRVVPAVFLLVEASLIVLGATFPWWFRIARELRDVGRALGTTPSCGAGRPMAAASVVLAVGLVATLLPGPDIVSAMVAWVVLASAVLLPCIHVHRTARRIASLQASVGGEVTIARPWRILPAVLVPPVLLAVLQREVNRIWWRATVPLEGGDAAPPEGTDGDRAERRRAVMSGSRSVLIAASAFLVATGLTIGPGPDGLGEDAALDELATACEDDPSRCDELWRRSPYSSGYEAFALEQLHDACADDDLDACRTLWRRSAVGSEHEAFAERQLGTDQG